MKWIKNKEYYYLYKSAGAGILLGLSRLPINLGFLVFFSLIPLISFFNKKQSFKKCLFAGILFSTSYTAVSLHWISLVTIPGFIGLFILFGIYFFLLFFLINTIWNFFPKFKYFTFISFWVSFEYLQNFGEFRFPWFNLGYSLADYLALIQIGEIGGIYLISILIIIVNILIYEYKRNFGQNLTVLLLIFAVWIGFGIYRLKTIKLENTNVNFSIVQVSITQERKWDRTFLDSTCYLYEEFTKVASKNNPDLIIWPESALPVYLLKQAKYRKFVQYLAGETGIDIFTGFPHYEVAYSPHPERYKFYNAASKFLKTGEIDEPYYKKILVPFGERMPFLKIFPFLWNVQMGQANFEYGKELGFYYIKNFKFSPLICFEIAFPQLTLQMAKEDTDFIVNITNDAWFKRSAGTYQHAVMTKFRAIETRKQIYRAANTGYSLIVSPTGKFLQKSKLYEKTIISDELLIYKGKSFFTKYLFCLPLVLVIVSIYMLLCFLIKILVKK